MTPEWEITISRDGMWPFPWRWQVSRRKPMDTRYGEALTKDRARRKALDAKRSMEDDDVRVTYP